MGKIYDLVYEFKHKYPDTVAWRLKKHAAVVDDYINDDQEVLYAFCA